MKRFILALTIVTASTLAVLGTTSAQAVPPIAWGNCDSPDLAGAGAECALVTVPLDYAHPAGATIQIAISRILHTVPASQYQGVMLVNPGGPGGSGIDLALLGQFVPDGAGDAYDWIGFDPRGIGSSVPALSCDPDYFAAPGMPFEPTSAALEQAQLQKARTFAAECGTSDSALLAHMTTIDAARDMDSIRAALGVNTINYYGFSYGSYLGQVYGTLFPARVRRMVLDGNPDPRKVWYKASLDQDLAFDRNIKVFFAWIARYDAVYHLGTTATKVESTYYKVYNTLKSHPVDGVLGSDEWANSFLVAGYYVFNWLDIASAFSAYVVDADRAPMEDFAAATTEAGDDNGFAAYTAVSCTDAPWPKTWSIVKRDAAARYLAAPFLTWNNTWYGAPCLTWPAPARTPVNVNGAAVAPILLISETLDAATPYEGSLEVRARFPRARLVEGVGGTTHAGSLFGVACIDNSVADYLATGALPTRKFGRVSDRRCSPNPQPVPETTAALALRLLPPTVTSRESLIRKVH